MDEVGTGEAATRWEDEYVDEDDEVCGGAEDRYCECRRRRRAAAAPSRVPCR